MKFINTFPLLFAAVILAGCSKPPEPLAEGGTKGATAATAIPAAKDQPRQATYDPNLKVDESKIVWDSPEKKKAWEARKKELADKNKAAK